MTDGADRQEGGEGGVGDGESRSGGTPWSCDLWFSLLSRVRTVQYLTIVVLRT